MNLIFLYGPPGVGKLTVAKALAKKTGYKVFHNHLTHDLVRSLFDRESKAFGKFVRKYRFELIEAAAQNRLTGVILTYVYESKVDDKEVMEFVRRVKKHGGRVMFVQLRCNQKVLEHRIKHDSRKAFGKIRHVSSLRHLMARQNVTQAIPSTETLVIDNTHLSPTRVATKIQKHWKL